MLPYVQSDLDWKRKLFGECKIHGSLMIPLCTCFHHDELNVHADKKFWWTFNGIDL